MKVKSIIAVLLLMVAGLQTADAQGFRVYKSDGTMVQFSLRTDSIVFYDGLGSDEDFGPFTPVNQCIVGTWYKSKSESVTFREDGTTDYIEGATYEFMPYQGSAIIYNASGAPVTALKIYKVTADEMIVGTLGSTTLSAWSKTQPVQLVTSIVLSETSLNLRPDEAKTIIATVLPEDADNPSVTWESSNVDVAEVNKNGRVIANGIGSCVITCKATDGSGVKAECSITVKDIQLVTGITLNKTSLSLSLPTNSTYILTATVQPADATNKSVVWSSSNTSVATVDQAGKVTAKAAGSCTISATAADESGVKAECSVTVIQLVTSITLSQTSLTLFKGMSETLTATVQPSNANNKKVTWSSSNTEVVTVDQTGLVTGLTFGSCTITAIAADGSGVKGTCSVTVDHEWVDLGLPSGTLWATCNVGAEKPEEYGDYFAWGETTGYKSGKTNFSWDTYKYYDATSSMVTKYCINNSNFGTIDNKTELDPEDDAATANWGSGWQMPSWEQCEELINSSYTTTIWTTENGVYGRKITSKSNGNIIFLPATGYRLSTTSLYYAGSNGRYWSRSLLPSHSFKAYFLNFTSSGINADSNDDRSDGHSIRAVHVQTR